MKYILFAFILSMPCLGLCDYVFRAEVGRVEFTAKGYPGFIKIKGEGQGVSGVLKVLKEKVSGDLTFSLKSLKTGIHLRDRHLKEKYLKVEEKGRDIAILKIKDLILPKKKKGKINFWAKFLLNGVERKINIKGRVIPHAKGFVVRAKFLFKLIDYKIQTPSFKGITVAEEVEVKVKLIAEVK